MRLVLPTSPDDISEADKYWSEIDTVIGIYIWCTRELSFILQNLVFEIFLIWFNLN